jgi:hypothetical protein
MQHDQRRQAQRLAQQAADHLAKGGGVTVCPPGSAVREVEKKPKAKARADTAKPAG